MPTMPEVPDEANLQRLGLYDPEAPGAEDWLKLVHHIFEMGATREEAVAAAAIGGLGSLSLDLATRPPGETADLGTFAARSGSDPELIRRLWRALGLPESGPVPLGVTPDAAHALGVLAGLSELVGEDNALALARVAGSSMARL